MIGLGTQTNIMTSTTTRGFTLLVASILASVALSVGFALAHLSTQQLKLAADTEQSAKAFYAASAALECALAADQYYYSSESSTYGSAFTGDPDNISIPCYLAGEWRTILFTRQHSDSELGNVFASSIWLNAQGSDTDMNGWFPMMDGSACGYITVTKNIQDGSTRILTSGTNTCDFTNSARLIERGISIRY